MQRGKARREALGVTRRDFLKSSAAASAAVFVSGLAASRAHAAGSDTIRIGLVGCGGRGTGAARNCVDSAPGVKLVALADLFPDRVDGFKATVAKWGDKADVKDDHCFAGFDAYQKLIDLEDVDLVLLVTPPGFRPLHFKAAVEAGKHVFFEKPVAVDPVGVRSVLATSEAASRKKLSVVTGTVYRRHAYYLEVYKRIQAGQIGDLVAGQCYFNTGELWYHERKADWTDMEWQCRNWLYHVWLSGDHIVEQHVHNLDVMNWFMGGPPVKCIGLGGRQSRTDPKFGNIFDHFAVEYEYANGARIHSMCRQVNNTGFRITDRFVGTRGVAHPKEGFIVGEKPYKYEGENWDPFVREHTDLIESIRKGEPINEGKQIAESSMIAILGRMSVYTGRELSWKWAMEASKLDLTPPKYAFGDLPVAPVAVPGKTELI